MPSAGPGPFGIRLPWGRARSICYLLLTTKGRKAVGIIESAVKATERRFVADVGAESFRQLRQAIDPARLLLQLVQLRHK